VHTPGDPEEREDMPASALTWPNWIGLVVEDLEAQRAFYRDVLGLPELDAADDYVQFDMGFPNVLEVIQRSKEPQYDRRRFQPGFAVADIQAVRKDLIAKGATPIGEIDGGSDAQGYWCYFRDPEGNVFEISQRLGERWVMETPRHAPAAVTVQILRAPTPRLVYAATVLFDDGDHLVAQAPWQEAGDRDVGYVLFERGDQWIEHYWRSRWYAVKEIHGSDGTFKGWYCDVARPLVVRDDRLYSEDLYLDVWVSADGRTVLRLDEDEFAGSGLAERDPPVDAAAERAFEELVRLAQRGFRRASADDDHDYADVPFPDW
jgi:catechol 2,3-dioxygenase-like lactoylglutathione lyase family enzyme